LNGYQRGRCFYCYGELALDGRLGAAIDVDHVIPHFLAPHLPQELANIIDGVWNLVLACQECNRGVGGKSGRLPAVGLFARLHLRNEFLVESHHPLRDALMQQSGQTPETRRSFLKAAYEVARALLPVAPWQPPAVRGEPF
jgi:hypothetical protein